MPSAKIKKKRPGLILMVMACALSAPMAAAQAKADEVPIFARVGTTVLTVEDYGQALREGLRKKFYHGQVPAEALAAFQREIGEQLITETLLMQEAERREISADKDWVETRLRHLEQRYQARSDWAQLREGVLARYRQQLEKQSVLGQLDDQVGQVGPPSETETRRYYEANPGKFTEPEQVRLSLILLAVDPSAPASAWDTARAEAEALVARLRAGADFSALAGLHSADPSAQRGGDMGRLHRGTLGAGAEAVVDALSPGEVSDPVTLLDGVAVFRLEERFAQRLRAYDSVRERARQLWQREQAERAKNQLISQLRKNTPVDVREEYYLPTAAVASEPQ
ncbi:MAG: peptidylprolyl isomerase [Gammaproteobacteria bacterium]|nr:peptidylprolyl isomerase [Gammaproteobacteria bacterium]